MISTSQLIVESKANESLVEKICAVPYVEQAGRLYHFLARFFLVFKQKIPSIWKIALARYLRIQIDTCWLRWYFLYLEFSITLNYLW